MHESAGKLDQSLIEEIVGFPPLRQPQHLQYLMGLEKKLLIETFKKAQVMRVEIPTFKGLKDGSDPGAFVAHVFDGKGPRTD